MSDVHIKIGAIYVVPRLQDTCFQVVDVKENGLSVIWHHRKYDRILGMDFLEFNETNWQLKLLEIKK